MERRSEMGLAELYAQARAVYSLLPARYGVAVEDVPDVSVVVVDGIPIFTEPPGFVWTAPVAFHECGHVAQRVLRHRDPTRDWYALYWAFRGFPGAWELIKTEAEQNGAWAWLPDESWAECFGASISGQWLRNEKTYDYQKPMGALAARAFFQGLAGTPMSYPIAWRPSPNFNKGWVRPPTNITLHSSAGTLASLLATFSTPDRVSAHFTVDPGTRTIYQHVDVANRAWHGLAANEFAIGIEHVDGRAWGAHPELTYDMSTWLVQKLADDLGLVINETVIGPHNRWVQTACPAALDWRRIVAQAGGEAMLSIEAFNTWRAALQEQLNESLVQRWEGDRIVAGLASAAGAPRTARAATKPKRLVIPKLPQAAAPTAKQKADVRKGHGRGTSEDVTNG